jgi:hypothetical protein
MGAGARAIGRIGRGGLLAGLLLSGVLLMVASCAEPAQQSMPCPVVRAVPDASYLTRFAGDSEDLTDTVFEARLTGVQPKCVYSEDTDTKKTKIVSDLLVKLAASRGPKLTDDQVTFNYVIALTGQGGRKIARQQFDVTIPLKEGENGDYYQIYVFLEVTQKELAYNRRNPRQ